MQQPFCNEITPHACFLSLSDFCGLEVENGFLGVKTNYFIFFSWAFL